MAKSRKPDRVRETPPLYDAGQRTLQFLLDSSIWVEFLRKSPHPARARALALMRTRLARLSWVVIGELHHGARSAEETRMIDELAATVPFLAERQGLWAEAGRAANRLRKTGRSVGLADCYLGVLARESSAILITRDRDFESIGAELKIPVEIL